MTDEKLTKLERKMREWIDAGAFPGCAFGIYDGSPHLCWMGDAMIEPQKKKVTSETLYDLASLTKVVGTVPAILHLIEEGDLTLETKIASVLPEAGESQVTVRQCLTHTTGAPADFPYQDLKGKQAVVERAASLLPAEGNERICYSDINYILLGEVIERISGMGLDQAFQEWIFDPLCMEDTGFFPAKEDTAPTEIRADRGLVWGQAHDGKAHAMGGISGHAGLFSSGFDIMRFMMAVLGKSANPDIDFLSRASIELMAKEQAADDHDRRGLGWMLSFPGGPMGDLCSDRTLFHTGFAGGSILIDMDQEVGFFVLTNRIHPSRENKAILELRPKFNNMAIAAATDL